MSIEDVGHHVLDGLVPADRAAELLAVLRVLVRHLEHGLRGADDRRRLEHRGFGRGRRQRRPPAVERADDAVGRRRHVVERHRVQRVPGDVRHRRRGDSVGAGVDEEERDAVRLRVAARPRDARGRSRPTARTRRAASFPSARSRCRCRCAEHAMPSGPNEPSPSNDREADDATAVGDRGKPRAAAARRCPRSRIISPATATVSRCGLGTRKRPISS